MGNNNRNHGKKKKPNLNRYIDNFFDMVTLYDDNIEHDTFKSDDEFIKTTINRDDENKYTHNYKGLLKSSIDVFLNHQSEYTAYQVFETFLMMYQILPEDKNQVNETSSEAIICESNNLLNLVKIMRLYEEKTGALIKHQRDHFIHSVNVFLLGLAIYAQNERYRKVFFNYIVGNKNYKKFYKIDNHFSHEEFLYRWGIAALFHDVGYPFEIIGKQLDKYVEDGVNSLSVTYDVDAYIDFTDFDEFNVIVKLNPDFADSYTTAYDTAKFIDLFKPTNIMAFKIAMDLGLNKEETRMLFKSLNGFIQHMNEKGFIDHGYFSAILVLNSYGKLIQKYSKNSDFFFYPIVDSASAILLHNYYNKTLQQKQFGLKQLKAEKSPIAFLLMLCDELQEWNRRPYGVENIHKNRVNDIEVHIDDHRIEVTYILKNGSMGLGFNQKKDDFISELLFLDDIFPRKLSIVSEVNVESIRRDIVLADIDVPDLLLRNIEKLAIKINELYNQTTWNNLKYYREKGDEEKIAEYEEKVQYLVDFDDLPADYKMSNIRQAKTIPAKLKMIGCEIAHIDNDEMPEIKKFSDQDVEDLAILEHDQWCEERYGMGWTYGPVKDPEKRISPYLLSWEELGELEDGEKIRDYDREAIKNIPLLLNSIGLKVVRSRIRSLTYKMNQFFTTGRFDLESTGEEEFHSLPDQVQFSNYRQAEDLVQILNESGYALVPINSLGSPVLSFSDEEVRYFAQREHECWYQLKLNLDETTSENFVPWNEVGEHVRNKNIKTFINLPDICRNPTVGLKIVKKE